MARTALVTGATGFIGSHLLPRLLDQGWQVRTCGRRPRPASLPDGVDYHSVDLAADDLGPLVDGVADLFHLAGASSSRSSDDEMRRDNVVATERLLDAGCRAGLERVCHFSTTAVYGEEVQLPLPVTEDVEPHPSRGYGKAKWETEQVVQRFAESGPATVVLRPVSVYGPGAVKLLGSAILDAAIERYAGLPRLVLHGQPVEQRLLHVTDLVGACVHLLECPDAWGRVFNVTSGIYPTSIELGRLLADEMGMEPELSDDPECGPDFDERRQVHQRMLEAGMTDDILLTRERFRLMRKVNRNNRVSIDALLGTGFRFQETDLGASVAATVAWYRQHRWIL